MCGVHTNVCVQAPRPYRRVFLRDVLLLCTALIIAPFCSHLRTPKRNLACVSCRAVSETLTLEARGDVVCAVSYASGMDKASFERVMLWWLKYREKGATPPHTGYTIVDGQELQKVLETKVPCSAPSTLSRAER